MRMAWVALKSFPPEFFGLFIPVAVYIPALVVDAIFRVSWSDNVLIGIGIWWVILFGLLCIKGVIYARAARAAQHQAPPLPPDRH